MANRLALFDCDGTLVDSQANICLCMDDAFARSGLTPPTRAATKRVVGLSLVEAIRALLPDAAHDQHLALAEDYKSAFQRMRGNGLVDEPLFDGIAEALEAIRGGSMDATVAQNPKALGQTAMDVLLLAIKRSPFNPVTAVMPTLITKSDIA